MKIGVTEILFVAAVLLIVFSASRMGAIGNALGKFVYSFRKAQKGEGFVDAKAKRIGPDQAVTDAEVVEEKNRQS